MAYTRTYHQWIPVLLLTLFAGLPFIAGCSQEDTAHVNPSEITSPPSVQGPAEMQMQIVKLDPGQAADLNISTAPATLSSDPFALSMPGTVFPAPDNIAIVSAPITGRVNRILAHEGEPVRKGEVLLELESLEFAGLVADFIQAKAAETYNMQQVNRLEQLVEKKISPLSALEKAKAELTRTGADVRAVNAQLKILGISDKQLEAWQQGADNRPVLTIRAPISGTINEHLIDLGQAVSGYEKMLSIINPKHVLIRGYLSPENALLVHTGDPATISLNGSSDRFIQATVNTISPALNESTKSVMVNIIAPTNAGWPLPGQNVQVQVMATPGQPVLTIPLSAIQYEGNKSTVFVRKNATSFEKRTIDISRIDNEKVMVQSGLAAGEEVAITQVFSLKALGRFDQYGE
ncbi:MAG: efflux RND transporter periplasmic adaptor subunit [Rhodothermales bacterium]